MICPEAVDRVESIPHRADVLLSWQDADMPARPVVSTLETARLILRGRRVDEAGIYRQLGTERDPRVPPHRRIDAEGRPTVEDIASEIRRERDEPRPGVLAVERKSAGDVIGYCGLVFHGNGAPDEPELAYELLRRAHGFGYATEAGGAVVTWATEAGYERLWATVRSWNLASRRVLERLRFRETGHVDADATHGDNLLMVRSLSSPAR
jgi:[ribosomal protein S5]-alanine N-acetyltransferase